MSGASTFDRPPAPHVLFAILDWGMGHATRTWPSSSPPRQLGARVTIATRGTAAVWIEAAWRNGTTNTRKLRRAAAHRQAGVTIGMAQDATPVRIAAPVPGYLVATSRERRWVRQAIHNGGITHVFSDNCYGCTSAASGVSAFSSPTSSGCRCRWPLNRWPDGRSAGGRTPSRPSGC